MLGTSRLTPPTILLSIVCLSLVIYLFFLSGHKRVRVTDDHHHSFPVPSVSSSDRSSSHSSSSLLGNGAGVGVCDHSDWMKKSDVAELLRRFRHSIAEKIRASVADEAEGENDEEEGEDLSDTKKSIEKKNDSPKKSSSKPSSKASKNSSKSSSGKGVTDSEGVWNHPLKPVNEWVTRLGVEHLFDWTWLKNGDYKQHIQRLNSLQKNSQFSPQNPTVVNDAREFLKSHSDVGVIVDDFIQLKNDIPHPLPRLAKKYSFNEICRQLNIQDSWMACKKTPEELSTAMPYTNRFVNVAIYNGFIDSGTCHEAVPGTVYSNKATFHFQRWTNNACHNSAITSTRGSLVEHDEIADSLGTYAAAFGHFPNQQMPRLLRMLATASNRTKVLVAQGGIADSLMELLIERKVITSDRIVRWRGSSETHYGKVVYRSEAWPYLDGEKYGNYLHDRTDMELMHKVFIDDLPDDKRTSVVIIKRESARSISNHDKIISMIHQLMPSWLTLEIFEAKGGLKDHMEMFKRARLVIGPHGAGFINVMWCKPGTHVVEVGYNTGMNLPSMYYEMSSHSGHQYWLINGKGDYASPIQVDLDEMKDVLQQIFDEIKQ